MAALQYRAFLSYSHADAAWAKWLHRALETYQIPRKLVGRVTPVGVVPRRMTPIFRDRDELSASSDLTAELCAAPEPDANPIGWLVWHLGRVQDHHVAGLLESSASGPCQRANGEDQPRRTGMQASRKYIGFSQSDCSRTCSNGVL